MKQSSRVALGGVIGALALVCMMLTIIPSATYAMPALAGVMLIPITIELGGKWGTLVYAAVGILGLLIAPDKEAAVLFVTFFGYYPILKARVEGWHNRVLEWVVKLAVFNVSMVLTYLAIIYIFHFDIDFKVMGVNLPLVFLAMGNLVFLVYDFGMTKMITLYCHQLHKVLVRIFRF